MSHTIAACQFEPILGAVERNCATVRELATGLSDDADVAVFPELCLTGYDLEIAAEAATPVPGPLTDRVLDIAADAGQTLVVGLPERDGDTVYNSLVAVSPEGVAGSYRKQFPWGDEASVFATGSGPATIETPIGTVGFLLCYDLNFPEAALDYARLGVDCLAVSAAWRESFRADWELLIRARALDTTCYVVGTNHAGDQRNRVHQGGSRIAGPDGAVLVSAENGRETVEATVEPAALDAASDRNPVAETRSSRDR